MNINKTKDWQKYENGKKYNNSLKPNYYVQVDTNIAFYNGDQWRNVRANGMPTPVFNIIKRVIQFFVASLTASKIKIQYEPLAYSQEDENLNDDMYSSSIATAEVENLFDKFKMDNKIRDACFDAAIMGDVAAHMYFDTTKKPYGGAFGDVEGEICFELVDGSSIYFGNANNPNVENQPYIIIQGRDIAKNLEEEARRYENKVKVQKDNDTNYQAGDMSKIEVESDDFGKATYIIIYTKDKETGTIKVSKCTESVYMYENIDTGLTHYPIAWLVWENQKSQYHGRGVCSDIVPNQIFINRMFAMVMYHLMMSAFPKAVYDADKVSAWTNEIGAAIPLRNLAPGENIRNVAGYLEPGNMSAQIVQAIELAISYTKETIGITDAALGQGNPDNFRAIVAMQQQAAIPLENVKTNLYGWIEDIGKILLDMMGTYYGQRPIIVGGADEKHIEQFDFTTFKNMWLNVKSDVGAASYWSEITSVQTLDNLLDKGTIDVISYLESIPDGYISKKQELIDRLKAQMEQGQEQEEMYEQMAQFIEMLPPEVQQELEQLREQDPEQYEQTVMQMMQQQ